MYRESHTLSIMNFQMMWKCTLTVVDVQVVPEKLAYACQSFTIVIGK